MDIKQYIIDERKKGTSDVQIFQNLQKMNLPEMNNFSESPKRGLAGEILPVATGIAGGIIGGGLGAVGGPAGIVAGAVGGSALGGALGETGQQALEQMGGQRKDLNVGQIVGAGATQGALELAGAGLASGAKLAGKAIAPIIDATRVPIVNFLSKMSGYGNDVVAKALERSPGVVSVLEGGEDVLNGIIKTAVAKFHDFSQASLDAARATMKKLDMELSLGGRGQRASRSVLLKDATDFVNTSVDALRNDHNIGVNKNGELLFARTSNPSRIVASAEKNAIQESYNLLGNIKKDTSISNIDATLERMIVLQRKTPAGTPTGPESKKIIGEMITRLKDFAKTSYPEMASEIEKNFAQRIVISQGKEILGDSAHLSPVELSKLTKQMMNIYKTGNLAVRESTQTIASQTGQDITGGVAGNLIKTGNETAMKKFPIIGPIVGGLIGGPAGAIEAGIIQKAATYIPKAVLENYAATGKITGDIMNNPVLKALAGKAKISVEALIRASVPTLMQNNTTQ